MNKPNQKPSSTAASPSVTQKPAAKPAVKPAVKPVAQPSNDNAPIGTPAKTADAPMHAAKGNDDIMSQPQASKIQPSKKKS